MAATKSMQRKSNNLGLLVIGGIISLAIIAYCFSKLNYYYDPDKAAQYATEHANRKSVSLCAAYVRRSLEAGGCPTFFHRRVAWEYKDFLLHLGIKEIPQQHKRQIGDVVVFNAVKNHPYGHIAIWNGRKWVSDFKQRSLVVAKEYSSGDATFFRLSKGKHKRLFCH